jgi:N6-L-threonylcarbamoyladenine synthase
VTAPLHILALETSCDETAAAVVALRGERIETCSEAVITQDEVHAEYGGVVPELASRAHLEKLTPAIRGALERAQIEPGALAAVAAGNRPGLIGSLLVGTSAAKAFAWAIGKPFLGVDHVQAHLAACHLDTDPPGYPAIGLVASGGHTHILALESPLHARVLARTRDDAAGEAFDKAASILGLGWPGGPAIERAATSGNAGAFEFEAGRFPGSADFSFSGLKTALLYAVRGVPSAPNRPQRPPPPPLDATRVADLCASFQAAVVRALEKGLERALEAHPASTLLAGGGVIRNGAVRAMLERLAARRGLTLHLAAARHCTDNAAMIGALAALRLAAGESDPLSLPAEPLSSLAAR